ncbi:alpha-amylase family glycosyl hydrolase [Glacieibacterium megasporae]|uniref:alpha-amylase family glycosyl hydrolase n=1 Tax=Glacieibacterium megasporae TaxID=2835787 RepID=UPI001C1E3CD0|nr:alpha-amylase family glycosyl hydrolase [Polymorphobacter megasporae]UAJ10881.1 alpha-amylase [Polymorphobacter megasporae]
MFAKANDLLGRAVASRRADLKALDHRRSADIGWTARSGETVYAFYVDQFAGTLDGVVDRLDYLQSLGIRWLHPLPLLKARPGESDGGFAVADYREVEPRLGDLAALERLSTELRRRDMGLVLDIVCNHTAREHDWAKRARAGYPHYRAYYHVIDAEDVAGWEATLIDVFPDTAPGNFTYDAAMAGWVWTTFYPYQWDLNYANPEVFLEMLDVLLFHANRGVQGFRLDSAPFLWKRAGTTCRNQPEAYAIVAAFRAALDIAAPSVVLLTEAIESPEDVMPFFGEGDARGSDLAYNNGVMTALWGALADQDAMIARTMIAAAAERPNHAAWLNYIRCHDDLIWNALAGHASPADLQRWSDFYGGNGFSGGQAFQTVPGGVPSTNGMAAALVGLGRPDVDQGEALARLKLLYATIHALDGWPMIYMGDEVALGNDVTYRDDPARCHEGRWLQRPEMDWSRASPTDSPEGQMRDAIRIYGAAARALNALGVAGRAVPLVLDCAAVLGFARDDGRRFLCLANLSAEAQTVRCPRGWDGPGFDVLTNRVIPAGPVDLAPFEVLWRLADQ